jgi:exodeoxyribonuclease VII small subunit
MPKKDATVTQDTDDIGTMPFERALAELETVVDKLEKGSVPLEESIAIYARGEALKKRCDELLKNAEQRIEKITVGANGKPSGTTPLDVD